MVDNIQLIHVLLFLIISFARQGGQAFIFSTSWKKRGIIFAIFCRVLKTTPHVRPRKADVRAQFSGFKLRCFRTQLTQSTPLQSPKLWNTLIWNPEIQRLPWVAGSSHVAARQVPYTFSRIPAKIIQAVSVGHGHRSPFLWLRMLNFWIIYSIVAMLLLFSAHWRTDRLQKTI